MLFKRFLASIFALLLLCHISGCLNLQVAMEANAGAKAKFLCSNVFISGRTPASVLEQEAKNATRGFGMMGKLGDLLTHCDVDYDSQCATCRVLWVKRKAIYREHIGATLLYGTRDSDILNAEKTVRAQVPFGPAPAQNKQADLPWPLGEGADPFPPPEVDYERLNRILAMAFEAPDPGKPVRTHGVVVVYDGRLIGERYAEDEGYSADTLHYGWSMTKSVAGALIGVLVRQGRLDIHDPAPVGQWQGPSDPRGEITIDQLLRMSSGLAFDEDAADPASDMVDMLLGSHLSMAGFAADKPLAATPGTRWHYSTGTSMILGAVIRGCFDSVQDCLAFIRRDFFDKIDMRSAFIEMDQSGTIACGSNMWATPRDWARFGLLCLQDGVWNGDRILPEGWMAYATTPAPACAEKKYGAHFWLNRGGALYPRLPEDTFLCIGQDAQRLTIIPSKKLVVVRVGYTPQYRNWDHEAFILDIMSTVSEGPPPQSHSNPRVNDPDRETIHEDQRGAV